MMVSVFVEYLHHFSFVRFSTKVGIFLLCSIRFVSFEKIKRRDIQKLVVSKYENGDGPTKIFRDLNGGAKASVTSSVRRVLKNDLGLHAYNIQNEPMLTDQHKEKRIQFANWIRTNFRKEDTMKILFSDKKMFDIDGVYNCQNDRIWAINRSEAHIKGDTRQKRQFPQKVMVWLEVCSKGVPPLVVFKKGTGDHHRYIKELLPVKDHWTNASRTNSLN